MKKRKTGAWIQYQLKLKGITQAQIGRDLSPPVTKVTVSNVIWGKRISRRIMARITEVLGLEFEQVWGEAAATEARLSTNVKECRPAAWPTHNKE